MHTVMHWEAGPVPFEAEGAFLRLSLFGAQRLLTGTFSGVFFSECTISLHSLAGAQHPTSWAELKST